MILCKLDAKLKKKIKEILASLSAVTVALWETLPLPKKNMNWLWVILIVGIIGAVIGYFADGTEGAATGGLGAALGCGTVMVQIFLGVASLGLIIALFGWLFGGCS